MAYLYGKRFQTPVTPLILELRAVRSSPYLYQCGQVLTVHPHPILQELYLQPYEEIPFHTLSAAISPIDLYYPHHPVFTCLSYPLGALEWLVSRYMPSLRRIACARLYRMVRMEDENTNCQTVGPVSKMFGMVVRFVEDGPDSEAMKTHRETAEDFLWMGREGLMMTGTKSVLDGCPERPFRGDRD